MDKRKPKLILVRPAGGTPPRQFRLGDDALADLDAIAAHYTRETGIPHTRTDAVRLSARKEADRVRKKDARP